MSDTKPIPTPKPSGAKRGASEMTIVRAAIDPLRERLAAPELEEVRAALAEHGTAGAIRVAHASLEAIRTAQSRFTQLSRAVEGADPLTRRSQIEAYLRETATGGGLAGDLRALRSKKGEKLLDLPALGGRVAARVAAEERRGEVALAVARKMASAGFDAALVDAVLDCARTEGRWSRKQEALALLADVGPSLPPEVRVKVAAAANELTGRGQHHWVQPAALATLAAVDPQAAITVARERLEHPGPGDDLLVRERIVDLASRVRREGWEDLIRLAARDPSDHVRILVARVERDLAPLATMAAGDKSPKVRASAILALARRHGAGGEEAYAAALERDPDPLVVQTAGDQLSFLARMHRMGTRPRTLAALHAAIERTDLPLPTRNRLADVLAETTVLTNPLLRPVHDALATIIAKTPVGGGTRLMSTALGTIDDDQLGRVLAVLARDDFPLAIDRSPGGIVLYRGEPRTFAAWRALFEIRNPTPSKRQSFIHTWSRVPRGTLRAPPGGMAELTATRVPGERVLVERIGGWGRHLPLVDDLLAASRFSSKAASIVGATGTTVVEPAPSLGRRLRSWATLTLKYAHFVELRRRSLDSDEPATQAAYVSEVAAQTGIGIRYRPHQFGAGRHRFSLRAPAELTQATYPEASPTLRELPEEPESGRTSNFVLALPPIGAVLDRMGPAGDLARDLAQYSLSPQGNRLSHVAAYTLLMVGTMLFRGAFTRHAIERDRKSVPIVIGGWGTRGKSGTERLKAGLFQGMGHEVLVKTTGCEAMFIHAVPGTPAREIFIYRPYDKATIWEQRNVLRLASRLGARVMLWECMALQPDLVDLLQHQWMRDDYSTITNAYPDHEDVQGPAGFDVATVISAFVPTRGHLFTAEDQMLPILRERARERDTSLRVVGSAESDLISDDLLARFPYQEHPKNIALVTMLARAMGVPASVAVAEMADNVVPDLGVLKVYPTVPWAGRTLDFTNGMSANERTGAIANWRRTNFDRYEPDREPARWIVTVVNNRADRIARSEVFARFLVEDIAAHRHFLIGTNVGGLAGFIEEALTRYLATISPTQNLAGSDAEKMQTAALRVDRAFARLMVVRIDAESVAAEIRALGGAPVDPALVERCLTPADPAEPHEAALTAVRALLLPAMDPELGPFVAQSVARRRAVRAVKGALARDLASNPGRVEAVFEAAYRALWRETVVPLHDSALTGDQIIDLIARSVPPRAHASIMGIQNIKGTGLDFVYRWVSLDTTTRALALVQSPRPADRERGMRDLLLHDDYGLVDASHALAVLKERRAQDADAAALPYDAVLARLEEVVSARGARLTAHRKATTGERVRAFIGKTFDYMDSIRRQNMAGAVLDDLVAGRVSHAAAAIRMRDIVARAKGAWMTKTG